MKIKIILLYILLSVLKTYAQDTKQMEQPIFGFYIASGIKFIDFDNLNSSFALNNISTLENYIRSSNYGFYLRDVEHGTYTELHYSDIKAYGKQEQQLVKPEFCGWGFGFSFNYDLLKKKPRTILYPKIGFDINKYELNIINSNYSQTDFNQILTNLSGEKTLNTNEIYSLDLGIGFEQRINIYYAFIYLGLNASYSIDLNNLKWEDSQERPMTSVPGINTAGFKIMFTGRVELNWNKFKVK